MWFEQPPGERILAWRNWRESLVDLPNEELLQKVAADWARVPLSSHYLHPELSDEWPNPWQLIHDNVYCELGVALGMCYSLALLDREDLSDITLEIYQSSSGWLNLSSINQGKYVLNYDVGSIVNIEQVKLDGFEMIYSQSKFDL